MKEKRRKSKVRRNEQIMVKVEMISENKIHLWKDNPRIHTKEVIARLAELIRIHGARSPIIVWRKNMTVYKGNLSLRAYRLLGYREVPVALHDFKNEAQVVAYALSDNKGSEYAMYDDDLLQRLLQTDEYNLTAQNTGFDNKEFKEARLLWDSDLDVDEMKIKENPLLDRIAIICPKNKKEDIIRFLRRTYEGEDIQIKG